MGSIHFDLTGNNIDLERKLRESRESIRNVGSTAQQESQMIERYFKRAAIGVGAFASMATLKQFGMELIEITGKFQTFEAVLTNTLQSPEKAKSSMMMLQEFAATTPFQVDALTGAFVKLANQGFVPTYDQMVKLGDLASSTGKGFDQLAEAIIDAQTGEFERLKEFGIRASKEGDKVTFTFKEQATQVDFTASSIRDYMLSLGDLKGVQGANAKIAETLTGKVSNLQDGITQMMNEIGQSSEGVLSGAIDSAAFLVEHYETVGTTLMELIAVYGTYKVAVMAYTATHRAAVTSQYSTEIAELQKLLPAKQASANADIEHAVAKGHLSQATAERLIAIRAEVQAELESLRVKEKALIAKVADAIKEDALALKQALNAEQKERFARQELSQAVQSGNAQKIRRAEIKLTLAEEELNIALKNKEVTANALVSTSSKAKSAATAVDTMQTGINSAAQASNTTSTNILSVAKVRLAAITTKLNAAIMANPYTVAAAVVAALAYGIYKLCTAQTTAERAAEQHQERVSQLKEKMNELRNESDALIQTLKSETATIFEKTGAYNRLMAVYPNILQKYSLEQIALMDIRDLQREINEELDKRTFSEKEKDYADTLAKIEVIKKRLKDMESKNTKGTNSPQEDAIISRSNKEIESLNLRAENQRRELASIRAQQQEAEFNSKPAEERAKILKQDIVMLNNEKLTLEKSLADAPLGTRALENHINLKRILIDIATKTQTLASLDNADKNVTQNKAYWEKIKQNATAALDEIDVKQRKLLDTNKTDGLSQEVKNTYDKHMTLLREAKMNLAVYDRGKEGISESDNNPLKEANKAANDAQLRATEDLYNSDLELKRKQTKDKIELINLNRDAAIAGIEKEKDEYVKLAVAVKTEENKKLGITAEVDKSQIDTSAYDKRITNVTVSAKIDIETATNDAAKEVKDQLEKLKLEFETFEQTRTRITEEYAAKRKAMREEDGVTFKPGFDQGNEDEAMVDEQGALDALDLEVAKRETTFNRILDGIVKMGLEELEDALFLAQMKLAKADNGDSSEKELARLRAEIAALQKQKESEESKSPEERSADKSKKRWGDTVKVMNEVRQTTDNIISSFDGLDETTKDSLSAATNVAGGIIGMITGIQKLSTMSVAAIKSVEGASVILAIIGAAVQIITAIFNLAGKAEQRHTEALEKINRERVKMQKEYNNLLFEQNMLLKEAVSIFGTDQISKAINSFKLYRDQLDQLKNDMKGEAPNKEDYGGPFGFSKGSFEQAKEDYEKGILGLKQIQIKTGHEKTGLFGWGAGRDIYSSVLDVYDDLVSKEGELNIERANAILSAHELSEEHKAALEQMIDYSENAKKAAEELSSYLEGTFGDLGSSIMDHVVDGVKNGTDAWLEFGKTGAKVLEELGKQIAYELFFSKSFKNLEEQLEGIYGSGRSELDIANAARDAVTNFYNGIEGQMDAADSWYRQWMKEAEDRGIKMGENVNNENSLTGAIRGSVATEQSVLELGGIFRGQWDSLKRLEGQCERGFRSLSDICILQKEIAANTLRTANNTDGLTTKIDATNTKLDEVIKNTKPEKYGR